MTKPMSIQSQSIQSVSNTEWKLLDKMKQLGSTNAQENQNTKVEEVKPKKEQVEQVVQNLNKFVKQANTNLKFEFHEKLEEYYVTIVDEVTKEVVKEVPPKKLLDIYAAMAEFLGFIVDEKI